MQALFIVQFFRKREVSNFFICDPEAQRSGRKLPEMRPTNLPDEGLSTTSDGPKSRPIQIRYRL